MLDEKLSWKQHTQYINTKLSKNVGILCSAKKILQLSTMITLYYSFIYPYLAYCNELWGYCSKKYLDSTLKIQKLCCRIIAGAPRRTSSEQLFNKLRVLSLQNIHKLKLLVFMFKFYKGQLPNIVECMYSRKSTYTNRTRNTHFMIVPLCKSQVGFNSIKYQGPNTWNSFCSKIDVNCSITLFSKCVRHILTD